MTVNLIWLLVAFAVGAALATIITLTVIRPKARKKSIADLKQAHEEYRGEVATHFVDTAKLVNEMTDSYKTLFDHLQQGAEGLLDESTMRDRLGVDAAEVITLSRLGFQSDGGAQSPEAAVADEEPISEPTATDEVTAHTDPADDAPAPEEDTAAVDVDASTTANEESLTAQTSEGEEAGPLDTPADGAEDTTAEQADEGPTDAIDPKLASVEAANDSSTDRREPQIA